MDDDKAKTITCPECQNMISLEEKVLVGDIIECPHCGAELRIQSMNPDSAIEVLLIEEEK